MNKPTVLIVDHETVRGINTKNKIEKLSFPASFSPFVWGTQSQDNPVCVPESFVSVADVNIVHTNNVCAQEFIDFILNNHLNSWVVEFSGGGIEAMSNRLPSGSRHCLYRSIFTEETNIPTLAEFLSAVERGDNSACDILNGFDPVLEAKLELLHQCLTPEGAKKVLDGEFPENLKGVKEKFWNKNLLNLNSKLSEKYNGQSFVYKAIDDTEQEKSKGWTVKDLVRALSGDKLTEKKIEFKNCFDPEYLSALSALRDCLLP